MKKDKNDMRNILLYLTDQCDEYYKGREQLEKEYLANVFSGLDDSALHSLISAMSILLDNIENLLEKGQDLP